MKKLIKILTSSFLVTSALTAAVVTPIEVTKNNMDNKSSISNVVNKQVTNKNNSNIYSILSKVSENKIENIISKYYENNVSKNSAMFIKQSSNYNKNKMIIEKAKQILNELYNNKLSYQTLIQNVKNKFNNLTKNQKEYINNKIQNVKNKILNINTQTSLFSYSVFTQTQNSKQMINSVINNSQSILSKLNELKGIAISMSVATAAQWVVAAAEACIWFIGWIEVGFTTAAAIADTAATVMAWKTYNQAYNPITNACGKLLTIASIGFSINDLWSSFKDLKKFFNNLGNNLSSLNNSMDAASAADTLDLWADPANGEVEAIIDSGTIIIDYINLTLDIAMSILGGLDCNWKNTPW